MSSCNNKKKLILNTVSVSLGCGCRRPRLSNIYQPKPKPKPKPKHKTPTYRIHSLYDCSWNKVDVGQSADEDETTTTASATISLNTDSSVCDYVNDESDIRSLRAVQGFGRIGGESLAVEKDSDDPYVDFRRSMLQMILEKEIYSKDDLRELLNCFLQLNSPYHHGIILRAFTEIWNGVFSVKTTATTTTTGHPHPLI